MIQIEFINNLFHNEIFLITFYIYLLPILTTGFLAIIFSKYIKLSEFQDIYICIILPLVSWIILIAIILDLIKDLNTTRKS